MRFKKGSTDGDVDIWVNNTTEGSPDYDGSGGLNTGTDNVDDIQAGVTYAPEAISTTYHDDIVIDTAFIGEAISGGGSTTTPAIAVVQDLTYTYDAVGNITEIVDASETGSAATTSYTYDDLYRLLSASTTDASSTPYNRTFTYDALGNILTKSDQGSYSYEGDVAGTSYTLYGDSVAGGWSDWSWWSTTNPSDTSPVHAGSYSLENTYTSAWGGLAYHTTDFDSSPYDDLELAVNVGSNTSVGLYLYFNDNAGSPLDIVSLEDYVSGGWDTNTWHEITIPLDDLDFENHTGTTTFHIESSAAVTINYDTIKFVGSGGDNYANPHAVTSIGGMTYTYDENGNLISTTDGLANTWTYHNELVSSVVNGATTTYTYDHTGQRVTKDNGTTVTHYPFPHYEETDTGTTTKHIYAGGALVATIEGSGGNATILHNHLDHLGSTRGVSDADAVVTQLLTYYPFGAEQIATQYDSFDQTNRFTGHEYDAETTLSYMGARYYDGEVGRFRVNRESW